MVFAAFLVLVFSGTVFGWSAETHIFIAKEAFKGISKTSGIDIVIHPEYAVCPDTCNEENKDAVYPLHFYDAPPDAEIDSEYIDQHIEWIYVKLFPFLEDKNQILIKVPNKSGALYWEVLELYKDMRDQKEKGKSVYYYSTIAHFIGDLSQPLHNFPYKETPASDGNVYKEEGNWATEKTGTNRDRHKDFDGAFDKFINEKDGAKDFENYGCSITINSLDDLKVEVSRIANSSLRIANECYKHKRDMNNEEAFGQVGMSISLLRAVKENIDNLPVKPK
jgi:hypothetical protein